MRTLVAAVVVALSAVLVPSTAQAHKPSDSYIALSADGDHVAVRWDIALRDLDAQLDMDANHDSRLSWGEVKARQADIDKLALDSFTVSNHAGACRPGVIDHALDTHSDGTYEVLRFSAACNGAADRLTVAYRLFADIDPTHRAVLRLAGPGGADLVRVVSPDNVAVPLEPGQTGSLDGFITFLTTGVHHILIGYDHLAFLFALLLPSVLRRVGSRWVASTSLRASVGDILRIVTAFTVAHSITLFLATMGWVSLSPRIVEPAIAVSVVFAALNNVYPMVRRRHWQMAFFFGLIHGFGFASALADAGFARGSMAASLFGFNLGVEIGQLLVVLVFLPIAWQLRVRRFYPGAALPVVSLMLAAFGAAWFIERAFDLKFLPI